MPPSRLSVHLRHTVILFLSLLLSACGNKEHGSAGAGETPTLWYKTSIMYNLDVEVFKDSDGDGVGDFKGLIQKLGYIDSLGVDAIWLSPFMPTPNKDDGYDISDFYAIDPRLGTMADFQQFIAEANKRHIRVLSDLVINHTSDQHPWFIAGRHCESPYHSWYVWNDTKPDNVNKGMVFPGVQKEIWSFDSVAGQYYYHRFYKFQPDLNTQNPEVQKEVDKIIAFWLARGVAGFRLDGVPFVIEKPQTEGDGFPHQFELLNQFRNEITSRRKDAIMLGEANVLPKEMEDFFGKKGDRMEMMFNFYANQYLFYALASGNAKKLKEALEKTGNIPPGSQWGHFLRNHDELDLGRLTETERKEVYKQFGPQKNMQLYDRGIRRRLAPMLHNTPQLHLAYSVMFSLPGSPVIRYGDEIGMGDDLSLQERLSVRTPMQWNAAKNAGFSTASITTRPVISQGPFAYKQINVTTENGDSSSMLRFTRELIVIRRKCPEVGYATWQMTDINDEKGMAVFYHNGDTTTIVVHNFGNAADNFLLKADMLGGRRHILPLTGTVPYLSNKSIALSMDAYGCSWFKIW